MQIPMTPAKIDPLRPVKIPMTPAKIDPPKTLRPDLIRMRDDALRRGDFATSLLLSNAIAWLWWTQRVLDSQ